MKGRKERKKGGRLPLFMRKENGVIIEYACGFQWSQSWGLSQSLEAHFSTSASESTTISSFSGELLLEQRECTLYSELTVQDLGATFLPNLEHSFWGKWDGAVKNTQLPAEAGRSVILKADGSPISKWM